MENKDISKLEEELTQIKNERKSFLNSLDEKEKYLKEEIEKEKIKYNKQSLPKVGNKIYLPKDYEFKHSYDFRHNEGMKLSQGGLVKVVETRLDSNLSSCSLIIRIKGDKFQGSSYKWNMLWMHASEEDQSKLKEEYGKQKARIDDTHYRRMREHQEFTQFMEDQDW
jgi:hypothetical protein